MTDALRSAQQSLLRSGKLFIVLVPELENLDLPTPRRNEHALAFDRRHHGAHEKSIMHSHPATVAVFLSDGKGKFTSPDGKSQDFAVKAGQAMYSAAAPDHCGIAH